MNDRAYTFACGPSYVNADGLITTHTRTRACTGTHTLHVHCKHGIISVTTSCLHAGRVRVHARRHHLLDVFVARTLGQLAVHRGRTGFQVRHARGDHIRRDLPNQRDSLRLPGHRCGKDLVYRPIHRFGKDLVYRPSNRCGEDQVYRRSHRCGGDQVYRRSHRCGKDLVYRPSHRCGEELVYRPSHRCGKDLGRFRWLPQVSRGTAENSVVSREAPWGHHGRSRGGDGNIKRACVVRYFRQKHDGRNHYETSNLCKSCNSMIVSFAHFILIIKHVL